MNQKLDLEIGNELIDNLTTDDHYTPPFIFEALGVKFDMDVSAPQGGVPWIPAKQSLSVIDDGLATEWIGRVWMNPPYSKITPWAEKILKHGNGIALLPVGKSLWFDRLWVESDGVLALPSNLRFIKSDGTVAGIMTGTMLFAFGSENRQILEASGLGKVR